MTTVNTNAVNVAPRTNVEHFWNEDNTIRVKVTVQPGKMVLKLDRHGQEAEFSTRHGHSLEEVRARALALVGSRDFPVARRKFRRMA